MLQKIKKHSSLIVFFVLVLALSFMIIDSLALPLQASIACGTLKCLCHCIGTNCDCTLSATGCACFCVGGTKDLCVGGLNPHPEEP